MVAGKIITEDRIQITLPGSKPFFTKTTIMNEPQRNYYEGIPIYILGDHGLVEVERPVVQEVPVTIYLNDHEIVTLLCLGDHL
ncbi:MAG: hypothetical protein V2B13_06240, partial [Pseudomonadota bacterium]